LRVGDLEVTPESVEQRPAVYYVVRKSQSEPKQVKTRGPTLVLTVRLKNVSADTEFCPTDPWFDRNYNDRTGRSSKPYTMVEVGGKQFFGGQIVYPFTGDVIRSYLEQRENDNRPLGPGEERQAVFATDWEDHVHDAVGKSNGPVMWRLLLRRGLIPYRNT